MNKKLLVQAAKGDSIENCPARPTRNVLKNSFGFKSQCDCY